MFNYTSDTEKDVIVSFKLFTLERILRVLWANVTELSQ